MSEDNWDPIAAVDPPAVEVKLFGKWNPDEVQVGDISLQVRDRESPPPLEGNDEQ